ncbi:hypothetical protein Scep_008693 [Stephania cephalantha]|uniref:Uncharacterized protein n=1 Tax=Stephania cephalantha TaxID=152367 RepID=A0AAP0PCE8_9MAGN
MWLLEHVNPRFPLVVEVETDFLNDENGETIEELDEYLSEGEEGEGIVLQAQYPWEGTFRDYEYEELLGRVFNIL